MDRRQFLKRLAGVAATAAAPVYFFPPTGGWTRLESGAWANNSAGTPLWASKTPAEIMADINAVLEQTWTASALTRPDYLLTPWRVAPEALLASTFVRAPGERDEALKRRIIGALHV